MASTRKVKQLEGVRKKLETLFNSINFEELNYGEIKIDDNSNFILNKEDELDEIIDLLNTFKNNLISHKDSYLSQKTTEKLMSLLQNDDESSELLKQIINKDSEKIEDKEQIQEDETEQINTEDSKEY